LSCSEPSRHCTLRARSSSLRIRSGSDVSMDARGGAPPAAAQRPRCVRSMATVLVAAAGGIGWIIANQLVDHDLGTPVLAPLGRAGFVLIFTVFMLFKREDLRNRLLRLAGLGRLNVMTQALDDASGRVSRYLLTQVLVNAGFGTLFGAGLYLIGVPNPGAMGRGRRHLADCAVRWEPRLRRRCRSRSRWPCSMDGSGRCACSCWCGPRTSHRQLHRTLALRRPRGDLFPGAAGVGGLLDRFCGDRRG